MSKVRFEAFSDGVFAFAITLLVLGLALPEFREATTDGELTRALLRLWPKLAAYALSFAVIGLMWRQHQALFRLVQHVDRVTVLLNLALLGVSAFIPFATSTLGSYPTFRPAAFLYGLTLTCSAAIYNVLLIHLRGAGAFRSDVSREMIQQSARAFHLGLATYLVAMFVGLAAPLVSFALYLLVAGYFLFPRGVDTDLDDDEPH